MNQLSREFKSYIKGLKGNLTEFCEEIGMAYVTFNNIFNYDLKGAKTENLARVCQAVGVSMDGLIFEGTIRPYTVPVDERAAYLAFLETQKNLISQEIARYAHP